MTIKFLKKLTNHISKNNICDTYVNLLNNYEHSIYFVKLYLTKGLVDIKNITYRFYELYTSIKDMVL